MYNNKIPQGNPWI